MNNSEKLAQMNLLIEEEDFHPYTNRKSTMDVRVNGPIFHVKVIDKYYTNVLQSYENRKDGNDLYTMETADDGEKRRQNRWVDNGGPRPSHNEMGKDSEKDEDGRTPPAVELDEG